MAKRAQRRVLPGRGPAGASALRRARRFEVLSEAALIGVGACLALAVTAGPGITGLTSFALGLMLSVLARGRLGRARSHRRGGEGEQRVGASLASLRREGWVIAHDLPKPSGGNVDHVAAGPSSNLFTIETKLSRFGRAELAQAHGHARWAQRHFEVDAVVAVLCVADGRARPRLYAGVWCMGAPSLVGFLRRFPGGGVDVVQVRRQLDRSAPAVAPAWPRDKGQHSPLSGGGSTKALLPE